MEKLERMSSSGSVKRPTSVHSSNSLAPTSPIANVSNTSTTFSEDSFSNNPDDYDIRQPIGYGSSAVVYNAYYKPLNKRIAIKVIDLDMFERNQIDELRRETQVMALCKHPNVLRVNGAFVADSKLYIVTPYLSAGSCLDIMKTAYPDGFDEVTIATILKQALQGLDYLHKNGHIHRDVKAGNLLVDEDGSVLLADFGVSSSLMENGDRRGMRKTFVGTPCWMAPEVMEQAGYDYKADIWSFGITAIELATGHAPFAKYPPIKVLMLTLSNDPPTLDRESTKHRYSKLLKEMIDTCLQKDPSRRPTAEKLLGHSFFKQAKKKSYLVSGILHNLPPLEQRPPKKAAPKQVMPQKGVSWDFDADDTEESEDQQQQQQQAVDGGEPVSRSRVVTFDTPAATTEEGHSAVLGSSQAQSPQLGGSASAAAPAPAAPAPVKKSRFVIEESPSISGGSGLASPNPGHIHQMSSNSNSNNNTATSAGANPDMLGGPVSSQGHTAVSPSTPLQGQTPSLSLGVQQPGVLLQGLGVTSSTTPVPGDQSGSAGGLAEVKKGRFSVKDTTSSLPLSSPTPTALKVMPSAGAVGNDSSSMLLMSPSRSLTSSPVDGHHAVFGGDGVKTAHLHLPDSGPGTPSERKSRFEVHHSHPSGHAVGTPMHQQQQQQQPTLMASTTPTIDGAAEGGHGNALSRESSQSRVANDHGVVLGGAAAAAAAAAVTGGPLSREGSATRVSRFSIETGAGAGAGTGTPPLVPHGGHESPVPPLSAASSTATSTTAAAGHTTTNGLPAQPKRSRFQVSSVDGRSTEGTPDVGGSSVNTTPNTSPSASLLRGQPNLSEPQTVQNVYAHLDTLYRQNEQQRAILSELFAGLGIKTLPSGGGTLSHEGSNVGSPALLRISSSGSTASGGGGGGGGSGLCTPVGVVLPPIGGGSSTSSGVEASGGGAGLSGLSSGSVHRAEAAQMARQFQVVVKENESLRRENEALKRELERMRRGGVGLKFVSKDREDRLAAIGRYISDSARHYDIVGLQEVWVYDDYAKIRDLCQRVLPYSKHWYSGVLGSGLIVLSRFPIVSTTMRRFALNGDPFMITHGDWYVGKCVVSAVIAHPSCGEIEVFNTHLHAGYDPVGTPDRYLGCRVGEAWEMASLVKAASTQGRHVISVGDYNSAPSALVIKLLTMHGGLTDSWEQLHPAPRDPIPRGLTPEQGVQIMGVTCDTPLNSWTKHTWLNYHTGDPIGERLDYIFYHETPELVCTDVQVAVQEKITGIGRNSDLRKNYSDHYGVHATFQLKPATFHLPGGGGGAGDRDLMKRLATSDSAATVTTGGSNSTSTTSNQDGEEENAHKQQKLQALTEVLEEVLILLNQHHQARQSKSRLEMFGVALPTLVTSLGLIVGLFFVRPRWVAGLLSLLLSGLSSMWIVHFLYGFLFGGEMKSAFLNTMEEVETVLAALMAEKERVKAKAQATRNGGSSPLQQQQQHDARVAAVLEREDQGRILK
ncbi:hypothetical protein DFQ26_005871 [Actinomortierella ambigua]|nr:hypothetical protein DFQ26_005871 [Actinomortierella ambigua]